VEILYDFHNSGKLRTIEIITLKKTLQPLFTLTHLHEEKSFIALTTVADVKTTKKHFFTSELTKRPTKIVSLVSLLQYLPVRSEPTQVDHLSRTPL
jgi:hypothetical protein